MSDRAELLEAIKTDAVVHGDFVLSSGQRADWYVDLRRVLLNGRLAPLAGRVMLDLTWDLGFDAVGGLTMGADPVATAIMHAAAGRGTPVDAFVVRKKEKDHGMQRRIEGPDVAGRRRMHHRGSDRVGAHRQPADGVVGKAGGEVEHDPAGQRRQPPVEQDPAQIDVGVGALARGQDEIAVDHGRGPDRGEQFRAVAHGM